MSEPPTMLIREPDDERTLIDARFAAPRTERPFGGPGGVVPSADRSPSFAQPAVGTGPMWQRLYTNLSRRRRRMVETGVVLALVFGLGWVVDQQRRAADALRDAIEEMKTGSAAPLADELAGSERGARAPVSADSGVEAAIREVAPSEREELEHRGASLIGSNNFAAALTHYQMLVRLFPSEAVFGDVVTVLKAKLRCMETVSHLCP